MRTCLPSASSAKAIASCEPMESPSGLVCEISRNRCRRMISSRICRTGVDALATGSLIIVARLGRIMAGRRTDARLVGPFRVELLENALDAIALLDRLVEQECELGHALQLQTLADLAPQERRCAAERPRRLVARLVVADGRVIHACLLQVRRDLDVRNRQEADAGVVHIPGQQRGELRANLIADAGRSGTLHKGLRAQGSGLRA